MLLMLLRPIAGLVIVFGVPSIAVWAIAWRNTPKQPDDHHVVHPALPRAQVRSGS